MKIRQNMRDVTLRPVCITIVAVEKQQVRYYIFRVCVCNLNYLACKAHALYYILSPLEYVDFPNIYPLSHKRQDFRKKNGRGHMMCALVLSSEIFLMLRNNQCNDWLRAGRSVDRIPVEARFSAPVQTGPGAHPASCIMGTGSFPGVKSGRGVTLTPHPLLVLWS